MEIDFAQSGFQLDLPRQVGAYLLKLMRQRGALDAAEVRQRMPQLPMSAAECA